MVSLRSDLCLPLPVPTHRFTVHFRPDFTTTETRARLAAVKYHAAPRFAAPLPSSRFAKRKPSSRYANKKMGCNTRTSQEVTHPSTTLAPLVSHLGLLRIEFAYSIKLISMVWLCFCSNSSRSINGLSTRNRHQQTFGNCLLYSPNYFLHFSYCFRNEWSEILVLLPE